MNDFKFVKQDNIHAELAILTNLINEAYDFDEAGFWIENAKRISEEELTKMVENKEIITAKSNGEIVGCLRISKLSEEIGEIGLVSVDLSKRGFGIPNNLMNEAENKLREMGLKKSVVELLVPRNWDHPKKQQLFSWYNLRGYRFLKRDLFENYFPEAANNLLVDVDFLVLEKDLFSHEEESNKDIIITKQLNQRLLEKLFNYEIPAIVVRGFADKIVCEKMSNELISQKGIEQFKYVISDNGSEKRLFLGVSRLGVPHSSTFGKAQDSKEMLDYIKLSRPMTNRIRSLVAPLLSPIDKLRLELDEVWRDGAQIANFIGEKMFSGIIRYTDQNALLSKKPHVDSLPADFAFEDQFAANIYVDTPQNGGELLIWNKYGRLNPDEVHSEDVNLKLLNEESEPDYKIKLETGDLVLFPTQVPHAINTFSEGRRISIQTFFAKNKNGQIQLWS